MPGHLILRLEAPLMSFGGEAIDNLGVVRDFPAASMLTGLIANALGWRRGEGEKHDHLQTRLIFGARLDRPGIRIQDFQTAKLEKRDKAWTTRGAPEGRAGGAKTYAGPHLRYRDYDADAVVCVALRLEPRDEAPTLDDIETALQEPARPLFLGRKCCLPAALVLSERIQAASVLDALRVSASLVEYKAPDLRRVFWPDGEGELETDRTFSVTDWRNWRSGLHGGSRGLREGEVQLPPTLEQ